MALQFNRDITFEYAELAPVAAGVRRIIARNPSPYTLHGTGTYVIGTGDVVVIDPGPDDAAHVDALLTSLKGERVSHVLVTHTLWIIHQPPPFYVRVSEWKSGVVRPIGSLTIPSLARRPATPSIGLTGNCAMAK